MGWEGMNPKRPEKDTAPDPEAAREAVSWIVGRLTVLEYLILAMALVLALAGGALVAWVLNSSLPLSFRWIWAIASLLLFILPGGFVYLREFRDEGGAPDPGKKSEPKDSHG